MTSAFFLILVTAFVAFAGAPKAMAEPKGDGHLSLYNYHEGEYLDVIYKNGAKADPEAIEKIEHLFRSRGDGSEHSIDIRLIELIKNIQDHFDAETIEIVSGYRSPAYNKTLRQEGHGAAGESLHMQGMAADIHIDEVSEEEIFDYVKSLKIGGAGLYPKYAFVHVDVGSPRVWQEAPPPARILVGTENNQNPAWAAISDKNIYNRGETVSVSISNAGYKAQKLTKNIWTEKFQKGKWSNEVKLEEKPDTVSLDPKETTQYKWTIPKDQAFGKYRLVIFASKDFSLPPVYSNEFYVKK